MGCSQQPPLCICYWRAQQIRGRRERLLWAGCATEWLPLYPSFISSLASLSLGLLFLTTTLSLDIAQNPLFCRKSLYDKSFFNDLLSSETLTATPGWSAAEGFSSQAVHVPIPSQCDGSLLFSPCNLRSGLVSGTWGCRT